MLMEIQPICKIPCPYTGRIKQQISGKQILLSNFFVLATKIDCQDEGNGL